MSRGRGRGGRRSNGGRNSGSGRGRGSHANRNSNSNNNKKTQARGKLSDYVFHVGTAKQANDYVTVIDYLIRHVKIEFTRGNDVGNALEQGQDIDFTKHAPTLEYSKETDQEKKQAENDQHKMACSILFKSHNSRMEQHNENKMKAHEFLWRQCSKAMKSKIESRKEFESKIKRPNHLVVPLAEQQRLVGKCRATIDMLMRSICLVSIVGC